MSSQQACVITNVDSLAGYALAYRFLEENRHGEKHAIRLLCRSREGLEQLEQLGGEIKEVDYSREDQLREHFNNVYAVILVPEHDKQRINYAENVLKVCKAQNVQRVCMLSIVGADRAQNQQGQCHHLCEYFQLEQRCKEIMQNKCHVVRVSIFNQLFYFMAPMIEGQGVLRLPIQDGQKWTPVDLQDVIEAFVQLSKRGQQPRGVAFGLEAAKELYQFTPTQVRPINELTREIAQGLDRGELRYETASKEQTRKWLQQMRDDNRFRHRPDNKAESRRDRPFTFPLGRYLNDELIDTILEVWQLANDGQMDIVTNDLKQVLGKEPQDIKQYFKSNRQQFRDLR